MQLKTYVNGPHIKRKEFLKTLSLVKYYNIETHMSRINCDHGLNPHHSGLLNLKAAGEVPLKAFYYIPLVKNKGGKI